MYTNTSNQKARKVRANNMLLSKKKIISETDFP